MATLIKQYNLCHSRGLQASKRIPIELFSKSLQNSMFSVMFSLSKHLVNLIFSKPTFLSALSLVSSSQQNTCQLKWMLSLSSSILMITLSAFYNGLWSPVRQRSYFSMVGNFDASNQGLMVTPTNLPPGFKASKHTLQNCSMRASVSA